jgi:hypothetical protein
LKESLIKIDSSLAYLSFGFIKKFDHFLTVLLNNRARLWKIVIQLKHPLAIHEAQKSALHHRE